MPTLNWIGKEKVLTHHQDVPYHVLNEEYTYNADSSDNLIIHGDNLAALKSLLPRYEGRVKCIYIDPPYNTGNEGWVYNDKVNDPKILKWLHEVVGKEGDDLSRHDKWLCMMYPRLRLLHRLLATDGVMFISIDDNEFNYLSLVLEEIFGRVNHVETLVWKKSYGGGSKSKHIVNLHEYICFYAKDISRLGELTLPPDQDVLKYYKFTDDKIEERGPYRLQPLATTSMDERPNLRYPILFNGEEIWPEKQWQWSKERVTNALANDELVIAKKKGAWSVNYKQYLKSVEGGERGKKMYSIIDGIYTQQGTSELRSVLGITSFTFPKPPRLVQDLIQLATKEGDLILDSFAGSGTTAHAILNLNKSDGGNRKFILVEMEDYAERITAERVKRVINGYADKEGTGGSFTYCTIGEPLFLPDNLLNEAIGEERIREYVWYTETTLPFAQPESSNPFYLGTKDGTGYYFYYERDSLTTLDHEFLGTITQPAGTYVIYADTCLLSKAFMQQHNIIFKKIPRDITRF